MPAKRAPIGGKGDDGGAPGGYVQVFLYRVPKANHDSFAATEEKLFAIFRRHGIVGSDLYVCGEARIFKGFRDLRAALEAAPEEEVWVEIDRYRDQADSISGYRRHRQGPGGRLAVRSGPPARGPRRP